MKGIHYHTPLLILAISVTILVAGVYAYMRHAVVSSTGRAVIARDIVRVEELNKGHEKDVAELYESTKDDRNKLSKFFVPSENVVTFIEALEKLEKDSGGTMAITSIEADDLKGKEQGTFGAFRAHVDVEGSWQAVMKALFLSELIPFKSKIDNVRLDVSALLGDKSGRRDWRLSYDIQATIVAVTSID